MVLNTLHAEGHFIAQHVYSISAPQRAAFLPSAGVCVYTINKIFSDNHSIFTGALFQRSSYIATVGWLSIEASPALALLSLVKAAADYIE